MTPEEMKQAFIVLIEEMLTLNGDDFEAVESACDEALNEVYNQTQEIVDN